jgi:hypothetical protein
MSFKSQRNTVKSNITLSPMIRDLINQAVPYLDGSLGGAQRFALLALGRAWILFRSRKNSKPEKCLKMATNPQRPVHALLGIS